MNAGAVLEACGAVLAVVGTVALTAIVAFVVFILTTLVVDYFKRGSEEYEEIPW